MRSCNLRILKYLTCTIVRGHYSGVTNNACSILMSMFKILKRDVEVHICICQSDKCYLIPLNTK